MSVAKENLETESLGIVISKRFAITNELFDARRYNHCVTLF
jgi:hypothetical protein